MVRPARQIVLAALSAALLLSATILGLESYIERYHQPHQNWLSQGSFRAGSGTLPLGWTFDPSHPPAVEGERSVANVPLRYLKLEPSCGDVWTEMPLEEGWRRLHVAVWTRGQGPVEGGLHGVFRAPTGDLESYTLGWSEAARGDGSWHLVESVWRRPVKATSLRLVLRGRIELAELSVIPSFVDGRGAQSPAH